VYSQVAIITPNFNKGNHVIDCIQSVLNQTYADWQLYFVDDKSTDNSYDLAVKSAGGDERVHILRNESGIKGANAARNYALQKVTSKYVLFLDSDDIMTSDCLLKRIEDSKQFQDEDFLAYPMGFFFDQLGDSDLISNVPNEKDDLDRFLERDIVWQISSPFWKLSALNELGGFNLNLFSQQDVDLHIRALTKGFKYKYLHRKPTIFYRRNVESEPRKLSQSVEHLIARKDMIIKHYELLVESGKLTNNRKRLLARYILDIAQMMRWHQNELGREATQKALEMWQSARSLVSAHIYKYGRRYILFKHQMLFNRFPVLQQSIERFLVRKLEGYIHKPSTTYGKVKFSDDEA